MTPIMLKLSAALLVAGVSASSSIPARQASPVLTDNEALLVNSISNNSISEYSFYYTQGLHLAGTNRSQAQYTADRWAEAGFDSRLDVYNIFLNYPLHRSLNATFSNGSVYVPELGEAVLKEDPVTGFPNRVPTFHGYSASGSVEAEYVYVGRGQIPDFERLLELGVELKGKIALSRYGGPFRGVKVKNAQAYGMIGCIMFTDLADDKVKVKDGYLAYPDGPARNPTYVQRGTVLFLPIRPGDPTTPGYPSKAGVPRTGRFDLTPVIPSLPISYINAGPLLAALEGFGASGAKVNRSNWIGDHETGYYTGPAPGVTLGLSNFMNETYTDIWVAVGIINGTDPNEGAIIVGNHRDAWMIGGAGDPNSGTAALDDVAKAMGKLLATGWKPKRTIVFASWDAEEYGMVGSTEWVEEHLPWLNASAATYINFDTATYGPIPSFSGTPELHQIAIETMKKVQWPRSNGTMFDAWDKKPQVVGGGSDFISFVQNGIATLDIESVSGDKDPIFMYHSNYDTYEWMARFGDRGFQVHAAMAQYISLLVYNFASETVLPFNLTNFATEMDLYYSDLQTVLAAQKVKLDTSALRSAIDTFRTAAQRAETVTAQAVAASNTTLITAQNKKYRDFHRKFVDTPGLPNRTFNRHAIFAPGRDEGYAPVTFPGITEAVVWDHNLTAAAEWVDVTAGVIVAAGEVLRC